METETKSAADLRMRVFVRLWRVVLLLRCAPRTLEELAEKLSVSTRTIRRDLKALQSVPLPIVARFDGRKGVRSVDPQVWAWAEMPEWPRREVAPIADVGSPAPAPLPPFPKGPLLPPGVRL